MLYFCDALGCPQLGDELCQTDLLVGYLLLWTFDPPYTGPYSFSLVCWVVLFFSFCLAESATDDLSDLAVTCPPVSLLTLPWCQASVGTHRIGPDGSSCFRCL